MFKKEDLIPLMVAGVVAGCSTALSYQITDRVQTDRALMREPAIYGIDPRVPAVLRHQIDYKGDSLRDVWWVPIHHADGPPGPLVSYRKPMATPAGHPRWIRGEDEGEGIPFMEEY